MSAPITSTERRYRQYQKPDNALPSVSGTGVLGTSDKRWASGWIQELMVNTINRLIPTALASGFRIAGGAASRELTVDETTTISNKAAKGYVWFMGG